jgi:hypothetical protein
VPDSSWRREQPGAIAKRAAARSRPSNLGSSSRALPIAADHPPRTALRAGAALAMADRAEPSPRTCITPETTSATGKRPHPFGTGRALITAADHPAPRAAFATRITPEITNALHTTGRIAQLATARKRPEPIGTEPTLIIAADHPAPRAAFAAHARPEVTRAHGTTHAPEELTPGAE